jgi:sec-independent protein translocase protein TatB
MFDLGWQEFLLVALVAVVVVGPKDLPRVVRTVSQWIRKARSVASEFQGSLEEMAREADLDDVRKQVQAVSRDGIGKSLEKQFDPDGDIRSSIEDARKSADAEGIEKDMNETRAVVRDLTKEDVRMLTGADKDEPKAETAAPEPSIADPETMKALETAEAGAANKTSKVEPTSQATSQATPEVKTEKKSEQAPAAPPKREES